MFLTGLKSKERSHRAWTLHPRHGFGNGAFFGLHIIAGFLTQEFGSETGIVINTIYENWIFQLLIFFFVIFHAINGLRVVILDIWPALLEYQREAIWLEWLVFIPVYGIVLFVVLKDALGA